MAQAAQHFALAQEPLHQFGVGRGLHPQELHGQGTVGAEGVLGPVHEGHAALAQAFQHPDAANAPGEKHGHGGPSNSTRFRPSALAL